MVSNTNETVLVFGASGNIGVSVITAALRRKLHVLAVVRNQAGAAKLFEHVGTKEGITIVEADPTQEADVNGVVEKVKSGKLPAFQHVYVSGRLI
jgi:short-subunit dehydrogenase